MKISAVESAVETAVPQLRGARVAVYAILAAIAIAVVGFAVWWIFIHPGQQAAKIGQAKVDATMATKATDLALDGQTRAQAGEAQKVTVDVRVQKGQIDVRQAPDAGTQIGGVSDRVRAYTCMWGEAAADPACVAVLADPGSVGGVEAHPVRVDRDH